MASRYGGTYLFLALRRKRQEDREFETCLYYTAKPCLRGKKNPESNQNIYT
jgi:hypothetical protein